MNGHIVMKKRSYLRKEFKNKGFVLTLFNFKAIVLAVLLVPLIGIGNINAQELFVSSSATHEVLQYNGTTGAFMDVFVSAMSGGLDPRPYLGQRSVEKVPQSSWGVTGFQ